MYLLIQFHVLLANKSYVNEQLLFLEKPFALAPLFHLLGFSPAEVREPC